MSESKVNTKVKVLCDLQNTNKGSGFLDVFEERSQRVKRLFIQKHQEDDFCKGKCYLITNIKLGEDISCSTHTMVMECGIFGNQEIEDMYHNPEKVGVAVALSSPAKKRLTVEGVLLTADDPVTGNVKRRRLTLEEGSAKIDVKLWGDKADQVLPAVGSKISVKGVMVNEWNGRKELNSTPKTTVEEVGVKESFHGKVEAGMQKNNNCKILVKDELLSMSVEDYDSIFTSGFEEGVYVKGQKKGSRIIEITRIDEEGEEDEEF